MANDDLLQGIAALFGTDNPGLAQLAAKYVAGQNQATSNASVTPPAPIAPAPPVTPIAPGSTPPPVVEAGTVPNGVPTIKPPQSNPQGNGHKVVPQAPQATVIQPQHQQASLQAPSQGPQFSIAQVPASYASSA